jgi:mRNA interferase HicA
MKPAELLRRSRRVAAKRGLALEISEGKSHSKIVFGTRRSVVGRRSSDLKTGTLRGILKQLGLEPDELEE